jgi:hypothetical protein
MSNRHPIKRGERVLHDMLRARGIDPKRPRSIGEVWDVFKEFIAVPFDTDGDDSDGVLFETGGPYSCIARPLSRSTSRASSRSSTEMANTSTTNNSTVTSRSRSTTRPPDSASSISGGSRVGSRRNGKTSSPWSRVAPSSSPCGR